MDVKIPVGILGATGSVGQKFIELLSEHPWFEIVALCASEKKAGLTYAQAVNWFQTTPCPMDLLGMTMSACVPDLPCRLVFSGLDSSVAGSIEAEFAAKGYTVVSNSRNHRMDPRVPLMIPEVNADHLDLIHAQDGRGCIVTNPNCSTIGLALALKPLHDTFGLESVQVVTLQALSGAGYPGISSLDIIDNVLPNISGEEDKMETEPLKILGTLDGERIVPAEFKVSAQCNRVGVQDGHLERVSVKLARPATQRQVRDSFEQFQPAIWDLDLPTAPRSVFELFDDPRFPQPRKHAMQGGGMTVSIGHLKPCPVLDFKFSLLVHNTIRGAAGGALLNAELLAARGYFHDRAAL